MCRHFEHTHPFGDTPSITLHSPLSSTSPKQKFAGFIVRADTQKNTNFKLLVALDRRGRRQPVNAQPLRFIKCHSPLFIHFLDQLSPGFSLDLQTYFRNFLALKLHSG